MKHVTSSLMVTEHQLPEIHEILLHASNILDIQPPLLFIEENQSLNAFAFGIKKPFVILSNSLVESLTEEELLFVIAHEVGHHKCKHILYTEMLSVILDLQDYLSQKGLGLASIATTGIHYALTYWYRKSELSCDRAGLLGCENIDVAITALAKIAGLPHTQTSAFDPEKFRKQAELYEEFDENLLNIYHKIKFMGENVIENSHPLPALRAKELYDWHKSKEYENIINGNFDDVEKKQVSIPDEEEEELEKEEKTDFVSEAKEVAEDAAKGFKDFLNKL